ncbi:MAG: hypothetical protein LBQ97_02520 [Fusobacteriaceae bacterium]|jgi:hypothetical protein|nr:hypothetical protein [Fusobacteriaceae bacterium]
MFRVPKEIDKIKLTEDLLQAYKTLLKQKRFFEKRIYDEIILIKQSPIVSMLTGGLIEVKSDLEKREEIIEKNKMILERYTSVTDTVRLALESTRHFKYQGIVIMFYMCGKEISEILTFFKISERKFYYQKKKILNAISDLIFY